MTVLCACVCAALDQCVARPWRLVLRLIVRRKRRLQTNCELKIRDREERRQKGLERLRQAARRASVEGNCIDLC